MSSRTRTLRPVWTFVRLDRRRKAILVEAALFVALFTVTLRLLPFRSLRWLFGRPRRPSPGAPGRAVETLRRDRNDRVLVDVRWALGVVRRLGDPRRGCLPRALAGRVMLRRRGYTPTLHIGIRRDDGAGKVAFHAWLTEQGTPVTGVRTDLSFATLAQFDGD